MPTSRRRHEGKGLPRCECGKAIYPSPEKAYRAKDRYALAAVYRCPERGRIHVTSQLPHAKARVVDRRQPVGRFAVAPLTRCPACKIVSADPDGADLRDNLSSCPHPVHWKNRDPGRPYYPAVRVALTGETSNVFAALGVVSAALRAGGVDDDSVATFAADLTSSADYAEALHCVRRWVYVT